LQIQLVRGIETSNELHALAASITSIWLFGRYDPTPVLFHMYPHPYRMLHWQQMLSW
jgi:hypothetical protein